MHLIDKILSRNEFEKEPPVLIDIGASGAIHFRWKRIARYCVCIAFDPDDREYGYIESENKHYKKLYTFNCIVSDKTQSEVPFYLTTSPFCSSFLKPMNKALAPYHFAEKFNIDKKIKLPVKNLHEVLEELKLNYVDWFKTDSQGMDLRIFKSLPREMIEHTKVAEFEPGIMDAYEGEDKLHEVLSYMEKEPFFLSYFKVKGPARLSPDNIRTMASGTFMQKILAASHKKTAGWGELLYLNTFELPSMSLRDFLLGIVIAIINEEFGFALEITQKGHDLFKDRIFEDIQHDIKKLIKRTVWKMRFMHDVRKKLLKES